MFFLKTLLDSVGSNKDEPSSSGPSSNEGGGGSGKGGGQAQAVDPNDTKNLGLGGLPSFFGYREDAATGRRGDAQIAATLNDNLPGYFNPETRDYVPWYVDLFDGGGINRSAGMLSPATSGQGQSAGSAMSAMQPQGLLANNQLSDMERVQRTNPLSPFGGAGPAVQDTPDTSYYTQPSSMQMPFRTGPGAPGYTPPSSMQVPAPAQAGQSVPASSGNMAINTLAAQNRDQMISDQMGLQEMNQMQGHPLYQSFTQSPFGEGDKKYYPTEFFKYLQAVGG